MVRNTLHDLHCSLGDTGLAVSPLGLGIVKFDHDQGVKYPSGFTILDGRKVADLLALARDLGINLIDTAPVYSRSEKRLGPLLRSQCERWAIVSEVGEELVNDQSIFDFSVTHTQHSAKRSLERLETERVKSVLAHSDDSDLDIPGNSEVYPTLVTLKHEGLISAYGLSDKTVEDGLHALHGGDYTIVTYNLNERVERPVIEYTVAHAKGILVGKVLASEHARPGARQSLVRASLELVFDQPGVVVVIVGTINPLHLAHSVVVAAQASKKA